MRCHNHLGLDNLPEFSMVVPVLVSLFPCCPTLTVRLVTLKRITSESIGKTWVGLCTQELLVGVRANMKLYREEHLT